MYKKYQYINLSDILDEQQIAVIKSEFAALPQDEQQRLIPYFEHYISVAIRERFPDIPKSLLRKRCLRIAHKEFACAYPQY